ncbi:hypothetical protein ABTX35_11935 [Streptomyces sp. NPDC096080]|uniref:hypothetical protein n=1 Tax=Streptomyces sp. NPDC096080 TaxID=3156693 RepID=UPI003324B521
MTASARPERTPGLLAALAEVDADQAAADRSGLKSPALDAFYDEARAQITESDDPAGTRAALAETLLRERGGACPDGVDWCTGIPANHAGHLDDHRHESVEYRMAGDYLQDPAHDGMAAFQMAAWGDGTRPTLVFQGTGLWPDLTPEQAKELKRDALAWLIGVHATTRRHAVDRQPTRTPFTETRNEQEAAAAFEVATRAMGTAMAKSGDRAAMVRAMRAFLDLCDREDQA